MKRLLLLLVFVLLPFVAACGAKPAEKGAATPATTSTTSLESFPAGDFVGPTKTETFGRLTFEYPKAWLSQGYDAPASLITYLSPTELSEPCNGTNCGWPLEEVQAGQPLIIWSHTTTNTVSRKRATPGACGQLQADVTIDAQIGTYAMRACLRGPDLAIQESDVYAMLTSVQTN